MQLRGPQWQAGVETCWLRFLVGTKHKKQWKGRRAYSGSGVSGTARSGGSRQPGLTSPQIWQQRAEMLTLGLLSSFLTLFTLGFQSVPSTSWVGLPSSLKLLRNPNVPLIPVQLTKTVSQSVSQSRAVFWCGLNVKCYYRLVCLTAWVPCLGRRWSL